MPFLILYRYTTKNNQGNSFGGIKVVKEKVKSISFVEGMVVALKYPEESMTKLTQTVKNSVSYHNIQLTKN